MATLQQPGNMRSWLSDASSLPASRTVQDCCERCLWPLLGLFLSRLRLSAAEGKHRVRASAIAHLNPHLPYVPGFLVNFVLKVASPFGFRMMKKVGNPVCEVPISALSFGLSGSILTNTHASESSWACSLYVL